MDENQTGATGDDAALDAELAKSLDSLKAGQTLEATPTGQTGDTGSTGATGEAPTGATGATGENDSNSQATGETGEAEFRIPNKGPKESDESYEKRLELFDLVKRRKAATTPEAKAALSDEIRRTKGDLKNIGADSTIIQPTGATGATGEEDPTVVADRARLKALGGATQEDIKEIIRQERVTQDTQADLKKFVDRTKELQDPDVREVFFDFVDANYMWQGKTGKELLTTLELAREAMFRPSETISQRVLKGADVAVKVNAMQFPGGTGGKVEYSAEMRKSIDEIKSTGMSEEKAIELLSE